MSCRALCGGWHLSLGAALEEGFRHGRGIQGRKVDDVLVVVGDVSLDVPQELRKEPLHRGHRAAPPGIPRQALDDLLDLPWRRELMAHGQGRWAVHLALAGEGVDRGWGPLGPHLGARHLLVGTVCNEIYEIDLDSDEPPMCYMQVMLATGDMDNQR